MIRQNEGPRLPAARKGKGEAPAAAGCASGPNLKASRGVRPGWGHSQSRSAVKTGHGLCNQRDLCSNPSPLSYHWVTLVGELTTPRQFFFHL